MPDLLDYRERYPDAPGFTNHSTSLEAAEHIAPDASQIRARVLAAIKSAGPDGLTADECAGILRIDRLTVRPRTTELSALGEIKDGGERRKNTSGRRAIVWVAV